MFNTILGYFSYDIGIDLGTANTLVAVKGKGIVINEPSVVAYNKTNKQVIAVGAEAKRMVGKTPANIVAARPLKDGVISDLEATEKMLEYFIKIIHKTSGGIPKIPRPRAVIGIPSGITEVEQRAVIKAAKSAGVRKVYLIEEPMAAAIGCNLNVETPEGNMIIDIGGGTTEIAVISLGGIVVNKSLRVGGDKMDEAIINYVKNRFNVLLGERRAEEAKLAIGDVWEGRDLLNNLNALKKDSVNNKNKAGSSILPLGEKNVTEQRMYYEVRGRNLKTGLPEVIRLTKLDMIQALKESVEAILESIRLALEDTPPELISDVLVNGIYLAGGGAYLNGLNSLIFSNTGISVNIPEDPELAVVRGTMKLLDDIDLLELVQV